MMEFTIICITGVDHRILVVRLFHFIHATVLYLVFPTCERPLKKELVGSVLFFSITADSFMLTNLFLRNKIMILDPDICLLCGPAGPGLFLHNIFFLLYLFITGLIRTQYGKQHTNIYIQDRSLDLYIQT